MKTRGSPLTFFHNDSAQAKWVHFTPTPSGDPDTWSIKLLLPAPPQSCLPPNYINCPYAGANLNGVAGPPPANAPSFDYYSTVAGASGGSPRLHMDFSDGGSIELRPLTLVADMWIREGPGGAGTPTSDPGFATNWDSNGGTMGGSCPAVFAYGVTYAVAVACHPGATVTDAFVVTDSACIPQWLHPLHRQHQLRRGVHYESRGSRLPRG